MKKFLIRLFVFTFVIGVAGELIIRMYKLVPDIPRLYVDNTGIQRYVPGQTGYYTKAKTKWVVNKYGWLGTSDTSKDTVLSIIGDSYIENIMNPITCNQGNKLKSRFKDYSFFEAGRSGVTFIEAMQISKLLDSTIQPKMHLIYVSTNDFPESSSLNQRYTDRVQIDLSNKTILHGNLKSPGVKKILYNIKLAYYLYLRFPLFVDAKNKEDHKGTTEKFVKIKPEFDDTLVNKLFAYCIENYDMDKVTLVFHPGTEPAIIKLANQYHIKHIVLNSEKDDRDWALNANDGHWSCYGHTQVAKQISFELPALLNATKTDPDLKKTEFAKLNL
ncbi:hypothetical protein [Pedobacter gandavensis]|uniref:SGNH/GDSL hydrolase family protein n=1 Tax=Pedobacter gandavensis TaxID=2679963 RepID=A0ABR6ES19_9SPHI|nr:hypothetical protein [Pedobacter gandavensis]MBB2148055.1 hypothetical protein [Pedobacter gandavensis]